MVNLKETKKSSLRYCFRMQYCRFASTLDGCGRIISRGKVQKEKTRADDGPPYGWLSLSLEISG